MELTTLILYAIPLVFVLGYSFTQLVLVFSYLQEKNTPSASLPLTTTPFVTFQLPVYNELYVIERLIDAIVQIDYPTTCFEIQVLDDSTDETVAIIDCKVSSLRAVGFDIQHVRRTTREGFKAGALAHGLATAKGEFIAIFDADFVPTPDFLKQTLPYFADMQIGVVQTRWTHLNEGYSLLTRLQAFGLDAHFSIEQGGRNAKGYFINFNGTAGIWRKACIEDAGGWHTDTLTEDLDLSYRAQLKGWKFKYLAHVESPAELPVEIGALKSQQFRWTKGAAECSKKHLWQVMKAPQLSLATKIHALFHLLNSTGYLCVVWLSLLSVPMLWYRDHFLHQVWVLSMAVFFQISLLILSIFYWVAFQERHSWQGFFVQFPLFLSFMMGLSLHNALAVIEAYMGKKTPFIRTPKFNIKRSTDTWRQNIYRSRKLSPLTAVEALLMLYFAFATVAAFYLHNYWSLPFHLLLTFGFGAITWLSVSHTRATS